MLKENVVIKVPFHIIAHNTTLHSHHVLHVNALDNYHAYSFSLPLYVFQTIQVAIFRHLDVHKVHSRGAWFGLLISVILDCFKENDSESN